MNVTLLRLKPVIRELRGIRTALDRIAGFLEADLGDRGVRLASASQPEKEDPELFITDEEADYIREIEEREARLRGKKGGEEI